MTHQLTLAITTATNMRKFSFHGRENLGPAPDVPVSVVTMIVIPWPPAAVLGLWLSRNPYFLQYSRHERLPALSPILADVVVNPVQIA